MRAEKLIKKLKSAGRKEIIIRTYKILFFVFIRESVTSWKKGIRINGFEPRDVAYVDTKTKLNEK